MLDQSIRDNIAHILTKSKTAQRLTYSELITETGLGMQLLDNAISYGIADVVDFIRITRALDLEAGEILAQAVNHVVCPLADAPHAQHPQHINPADPDRQPEDYPA